MERSKKAVTKNTRHFKTYIYLLQADCIIHDDFVAEYKRKWGDEVSYPAFKELALAYERNGEYRKAIYISKLAIEKDVNEHTSFDNRIKRLKRKLIKD